MIDLLQAPVQDALLWDANQTVIKVKSYRDTTAYFRVLIHINDVLFTTQNWSKNSDGISQQDLQQLYYNYFKHSFTAIASGTPSITALTTLKKKVSITVQECAIGTTTVLESIDLPDYYIHFNELPEVTTLDTSLIVLSPNILKAPVDGKVRLTVYSDGSDIDIEVVDDQTVTNIASTTLSVAVSGMHYIDVDLDSVTTAISGNASNVSINISSNSVDKTVVISLSRKRLYSNKQLYYRDSYGVYQSAYLFGQESTESELAQLSYLDNNLSPVTYFVEDMETIEIGSGNDYLPLTTIMHAISRSIDVKLYLDNLWTSIHCKKDKVMRYIERQYIYQEVLTFTRNNFKNVETANYIAIPEINDITFTQDENTLVTITEAILDTAAAGFVYDRFRIISPSNFGRYGYNANGRTTFSYDSRNPPAVFIPEQLIIDDIVNIIYLPYTGENGLPLDSLLYQLGNGIIWSQPANIILNFNDLNPGNRAPIINYRSDVNIALDANGDGQAFILNVSITDPDGDSFTVLWEVLNGAPITLLNTDSATNNRFDVVAGTPNSQYQVRITATDSQGNSSFHIIYVNTVSNVVSASRTENVGESTATVTVYDFLISGLPQGESVDLLSESATTTVGQAFRVDYLQTTEKTASSYQRIIRNTVTNPSTGDFTVKIAFDNISANTDAKLFVKLENPTAGFIKDPDEIIEINPSN